MPVGDVGDHAPPYDKPLVPPGSPLPFFEAALARSRDHHNRSPLPPDDDGRARTPLPASPRVPSPLPPYTGPFDLNHPELVVRASWTNTPRRQDRLAPGIRGDRSRDGSGRAHDQRFGSDDQDVQRHLLEKPVSVDHGHSHPTWEPQPPISEKPQGDSALSSTQHYGPAPSGRVGRRAYNAAGHRRIKQAATLDENGFFAIDMPIPTRLAQFLPIKGVEEQRTTRYAYAMLSLSCWLMLQSRYTAVTIDPDAFSTSGLRLRQNTMSPPRQTELFIVITMFNENAELFCRTLYGVMKNIAHLCGRKNSRVWGRHGWQKVGKTASHTTRD